MPKRVMILEDDADLRDVLEDVVSTAGHEVLYSGSDADVLERVKAAVPDLVFLDLRLGGALRGEDVYAALRADARTKNLPIVICTVHREQSVSRKLGDKKQPDDKNLHALYKPFHVEQALQLLKGILG